MGIQIQVAFLGMLLEFQGIRTQNLLVGLRAQEKSCPSEQRGPPEQLIQSAVALSQLSNCPPTWAF